MAQNISRDSSGNEEWTPDSSYSSDRYYNAASNRYGVSSDARVSFPKSALGYMARIVSSKHTPYTHISDFIRDRAYHGMHHWAKVLDRPDSEAVSMFMLSIDLDSLDREYADAEKFVKSLGEQLDHAKHAPERMGMVLTTLYQAWLTMPSYMSEWRNELAFMLDKYRAEVSAMFPNAEIPKRAA